MKIIEINGDEAIADISGVTRSVNIQLIDELKKGDYVIVHAGVAIERLSEVEAMETLNLLRELAEFNEQEESGVR